MKIEPSNRNEVWRDIKGFEGKYQVSSLGNVRNVRNGKNSLLYQSKMKNGYLYVQLWKNNKAHLKTVHRLVLSSFTENSDMDVNHIDGIKSNNERTNLEWVTKSENMVHAFENGLCTPHSIGSGRKNKKYEH